jgi:hypothetical protein
MSADMSGQGVECSASAEVAVANSLPLNLILDPALEVGYPPQVLISGGAQPRLRVIGQVLVPITGTQSVAAVKVQAKVLKVNDPIPDTAPQNSDEAVVTEIPSNDESPKTYAYMFTDDTGTNPSDCRVKVGGVGFHRLVVWSNVTYSSGQPAVCISQTCLQFEAVAQTLRPLLGYVEKFTVSKPLRSSGPAVFTYTYQNDKLCECLATADRQSSGIVKVAAKIFVNTKPSGDSALPNNNSGSGLTPDGWQVIDYNNQAQASIKFRKDLYNNQLLDYRIPLVNPGTNVCYLVVIAQFLDDRNRNWIEAYNANRLSPIEFKVNSGTCS